MRIGPVRSMLGAVLALTMISAPALFRLGPASAVAGRILIYGPSLFGVPNNEQTLAQAAGFDVTVADALTWSTMSTFDFSLYDAIVFGDPTCTDETPATLATAEANSSVWGAAVGGPIVLIGTDPIYHQSQGQAN